MEAEAEKQRRAGAEDQEKEKRRTGGPWREEEVKALLSVWPDRGAAVRGAGEGHNNNSRADWERLSSRLRDLGFQRSWIECQAQCKALGVQARRTQQTASGQAAVFSSVATGEPRLTRGLYNMVEESSLANQRGPSTVVTLQEDSLSTPHVLYTGSEGGRHWSDEEVRALLLVWADRHVQQQLQRTLRNKSIFQEMARRLQQQYGVVRDWKQCRTKYKNLKYEYKIAKTTQAAGMVAATSGQVRAMKFFSEVESILRGKELDVGEEEDREEEEEEEERIGNLNTQMRVPGGDQVIKIDDDEAPEDMGRVSMNSSPSSPSQVSGTIGMASSDKFNVITVHDSGRNWSEEEVDKLISIWSEEGIRRQLENSTRNKNIFVQISRRLLQQGVERDWKQCRTKYKNLKYLYRSLQRGKADIGDPRRIMKYYDQLDTILTRSAGSSDMGYMDTFEPTHTTAVVRINKPFLAAGFEEQVPASPDPKSSRDFVAVQYEPRVMVENILRGSKSIDAVEVKLQEEVEVISRKSDGTLPKATLDTPFIEESAILRNEGLNYKAMREIAESTSSQTDHTVPNRTRKRKATDEDNVPLKRLQRDLDDENDSTNWSGSGNVDIQCKEEQDQYIPIIEISSVCSMATPSPAQEHRYITDMASTTSELKLGQKLNEGKTKQIFELPDEPGHVLVQSKDQITAGNAVRKDQMEGKAAIANKTTSCVFKLLQEAGIKTAFVRQTSETAFVATRCEMIPIEWVCRRVATGSFLKRNPGVKEGYRFSPLKMEMFFKDDANNDPQWSEEQVLAANFDLAGLAIGRCEVDIMNRSTVAIFEVLERAWATQNCTLVDMKIEFGVNVTTKEIVLADVIDNDSWRLWPAGDRSQQKDKQVYRDLKEVTPEAMQMVKRNFEWVAERVQLLLEPQASGRVVVLMGSTSDMAHCEKIRKACGSYGIPCILRVTSAHKGPDETLRIKAEYEGDGMPTVFVAVAGRSNGLGPVMSGNTAYPVINCPPITPDWGAQDVWSSLRMPSGLGCSTILSPEAAAQFAAQIFGLTNHMVWCKLRASMLNTWISLKQADKKLQACSL
ncbi:multifunctional protein ADE2 isoform X1 [Alosa sapidissima]|uniref:multifunctional protein ADE2 isoform X1 n=1 Tax=Alosa sapidissima TaxID=34773 RepID=UPI001C083C6D|nr:multifunctional protein ADE2 isoform X1 [Alosa sapidissima]